VERISAGKVAELNGWKIMLRWEYAAAGLT
jgi:hypothetical protein